MASWEGIPLLLEGSKCPGYNWDLRGNKQGRKGFTYRHFRCKYLKSSSENEMITVRRLALWVMGGTDGSTSNQVDVAAEATEWAESNSERRQVLRFFND